MPLPVAPDIAPLACEALLAQASVVSLVSDRIYTSWPEDQLWPMITVDVIDVYELLGEPEFWTARIQVNCWGQGLSLENEHEASLIARTVQSVVRDMRGDYTTGTITNSAPSTVVPAPDNGWWRYVIDLYLEFGS